MSEGQAVSRNDAQREVMRSKALALRSERGMTYRKIGAALGVSHNMAHIYVREALKEIRIQNAEDAHEVRALELVRLDTLWATGHEAMIRAMRQKDWSAVASLINAQNRVIERRAAMLGLDVTKYLPLLPPTDGFIPVFDLSRLSVDELHTFEVMAMKAQGIDAKPFGLLAAEEVFEEHEGDEVAPVVEPEGAEPPPAG